MISSRTLRNFVQMHEYKLDAKISQNRVRKINSALEETHWGADCLDDRRQRQATEHWHAVKSDRSNIGGFAERRRQRPQSRYFNFILTATS